VALDQGLAFLELRGLTPAPGVDSAPVDTRQRTSETIQLTDLSRARNEPRFGLESSDVVGNYIVEIPRTPVLDASTVSYADVVAAKPDQLRAWFEGKAIIIGDIRAKRDGPFPYSDGRQINGIYAHAAGIESLLSQQPIVRPRFVGLLGIYVRGRYVYDAIAVAVGCVIGLGLARQGTAGWTALLIVLLLAGLVIIVSLLAYRESRVLYTPSAAIVGLPLAFLLSWKVHRSAFARQT
jgi:CHASE2 domain-containing sensor protein